MTQQAQQPVTSSDGCPECGPSNPLTAEHGVQPGMTPVLDGDVLHHRPCSTCNPERYAAWQTGSLVSAWECRHCGATTTGRIVPRGPGLRLECGNCGTYERFIGKREIGLARRSTRTRPDLKPSQRTRVLLRAGHRCEQCGTPATGTILHLGHILSREDGRDQGVPEELLDSDTNLIAQCEQCNLGLGKSSLPPWLAVGLLRAHAGDQGGEPDA